MCKTISLLISRLLLLLIRMYQLVISPFTPPSCRFTPSCSQYAREVLQSHPPFHAMKLIFKRLTACHPWGGYGYDPPPKP